MNTTIKRILSSGYLFLVVLGILKETLFYNQLGINILKYASLMDILISPIADITSHIIILISVVILTLIAIGLPYLFSKNIHKKWVRKMYGIKDEDAADAEKLKNHFSNYLIAILSSALLSFFCGIGLGQGKKIKERIASDTLKYDRTIIFNSGDTTSAYLVGNNSMYYFYCTPNEKTIKIAPVGAIKNLELDVKNNVDLFFTDFVTSYSKE